MYCSKCGEPIPDEAGFCAKCGAAVTPDPNAMQSGAQTYNAPAGPPYAPPQPYPRKRMSRTVKAILIVSAVLVVAAAGVATALLLIEGEKNSKFEAATDLMNEGKSEEAKAAFLNLKDYKDSGELAEKCQIDMDYDAAKALFDAGKYEEAEKAFAELGEYEDAAKLALLCRNKLDYNAAVALKDGKNYTAALAAFNKLTGYEDSAELAALCQKYLDYDAAKALLAAKDYSGAEEAFTKLGSFEDSEALALECSNSIKYIEADAAFKEGKFFTAYEIFSGLVGFNDSDARMKACIQKKPGTKEIYHNKKYSKKNVTFKIKTANDKIFTFMKIYASNGDLVSMVFIAPGKTAKFRLPSGTYKIKEAMGKGNWYGTKEMFGTDGSYEVLLFSGGAETCKLKSNYIYTLTLRDAKKANVNSRAENMTDF